MPTPNKDESKKDFLNRCIPIVIDEGTTDDPRQAVAICSSMYDKWKADHTEYGFKEINGNLKVFKK